MKKGIHHSIFVWILALTCLTGCTGSLSLQVLRPADISMPKDVLTLALVNRYKPEKSSQFLNVLEGILSGEGIRNDRKGAEASLNGLSYSLSGSPRFQTVMPPLELKGSGLGSFPAPLTPTEVRGICDMYKANALVTIEAFDSDSKIEYGTYEKTVKKNNVDVKVPMHTAKANVHVTVGWRIYNSFDGTLLDEYMMDQWVSFNGEGISQQLALSNLPQREEIVRRIGEVVGDAYAYRISPQYIWVNRQWFSKAKGNPAMKSGKAYMHADSWDKAREQYLEASQDPNPKVQGRALYNLALLSEVDGDLERAMDYCDEAIGKGNKDARDYKRVLQNRVYEQQRADEQMSK
jgi:Family of unknown function (DUF6340)